MTNSHDFPEDNVNPQAKTTVMYVNASVYSPVDPFATAILVDGPTVAWLGSDSAAHAMTGDRTTVTDVAGAVITPSFVAHQRITGTEQIVTAAQGYGAVELLSDSAEKLTDAVNHATEAGLIALPVLIHPVRDATDIEAAGAPRSCLGMELTAAQDRDALVAAVTAHLVACSEGRYQAVIICGGGDDAEGAPSSVIDAVLEAAQRTTDRVGQRAFRSRGHRLVGVGELSDEQSEELARHALSVSSRPGAAPLTALARAGVPSTLITAADNPWQAVKDALEAAQPRHRTSARAAFLALTRGVWRTQRDAQPLAGQLAPGAEASLAMWDAESLMVQQAAGTGASWSTDPRARTPALPALDDPRLPTCERVMVAGNIVFE
ncbi:hypothetical protein [Kocuria sp. cx-455]|uniref:hypothetical protein n=1 Tax=Kocuria sp. cx-455 TaxID=2771377 RepID=UPI003D703AC3